MLRIAVVLLSAYLAFAAPGVKDKEPPLYFPINVGSKRTYETKMAGEVVNEHTQTVTKVESLDGKHKVWVEHA